MVPQTLLVSCPMQKMFHIICPYKTLSGKPQPHLKLLKSKGKESKVGFGFLQAKFGMVNGPVTILEDVPESQQKCLFDYLCKQMGYSFAEDFYAASDFIHGKVKERNRFELRRISCDDESKISSPTVEISRRSSKMVPMVTYVLCGPYTGVCPIAEKRNFLMRVCFDDFGREVLQCPFSPTIYITTTWARQTFAEVSAKCESDPYFYQGCGISKPKTLLDLTINEAAICGDFICATKNTSTSALEKNIDYLAVSMEFVCGTDETCLTAIEGHCPLDDIEQDCPNQEISKDFCSLKNETIVKLPTGRTVPKFKVCNGRCDDHYRCEDEALCGGYIYGTYCLGLVGDNIGLNYIKPDQVCDGQPSYLCLDGEDERDCPKVDSTATMEICEKSSYKPNSIIPLTNRTRCSAPWRASFRDSSTYSLAPPMCSNFLDQTNCSDPVLSTVICRMRGMISNVSKYFVCHDQSGIPALCDNGIDQECTSDQVSVTCKLHRHQQCDSIKDCPDGSDEKLEICRSMTEKKCHRAYGHERSLAIPFSWLRDRIEDCLDGLDERNVWPSCGKGRTKRFVTIDEKLECDEVFLCSHEQEAFVQFRDLCDGYDSCGNEKRICDKSHLAIPITVDNVVNIKINDGVARSLIYCLPGLEVLQSMTQKCVRREVNLFGVKVFGVKTEMTFFVPDQIRDCDYTFGEIYVILSCSGYCKKSNCPIKNKIRHDSCPGQYRNRIYTLAENKYLTFATKSREEFRNEYFLCDNGFCIDLKHVCNLIDECGDGSDEYNCTNSLMCDSKENRILISEKCDGKIDCLDFSDECNSDCGREILHNFFLKGLCWILALLATGLNMVSIKKTLSGFQLEMSKGALNNKIFILLINIGDLVIGVYLLQISVVDSIIYGKSYCKNQLSWLSSLHCIALGIISTTGYEVSLISVTALGIARVIGIRNGLLNVKCKLTGRLIIPRVFTAMIIIALSLAMALVPLMHQFEDFFVNGMTYKPSSRLFIGSPGKGIHLDVLQEYYGKVKEKNLKWAIINDLIDDMFSHDYIENAIGRKKLEFYGNEGVCLFKFFVKSDDPQRFYAWLALAFNMALLSIVSACYIKINVSAKKNTQILTQEKTPMADKIRKRNRKLQRKISLIIATDLMCWLPVTIVSCLHSADVFDATPYYPLISIVFLPINSVINPIFYNDIFIKKVTIWVKWLLKILRKKFNCCRSRKVFPGTISPPALPGMPLAHLSPPASPPSNSSPPAAPFSTLSPPLSSPTNLSPLASPQTIDLSTQAPPPTDLSPPASPATDLSPPASPLTDLSPPASSLTDLSPSASSLTDLSPPVSPLTDLSPSASSLTDLSPQASPFTDLSPPASPPTNSSPQASPFTDLSPETSPLTDLSPSASPLTD